MDKPKGMTKTGALVVAGLLAVAAFVGFGVDTETPGEPAAATVEITPAMVVDASFTQQSLTEFCKAYYLVGDDLGYAAFSDGYHQPAPSAREVFDEAVSRCP